MQKLVACFILVLLVAVCIDAQRGGRDRGGRGGQGRPGGRGGQGGPGGRRGPLGFPKGVDKDMYEWIVDVDSAGTTVPQKAFVLKDADVVVLLTFSKNLKDLNMTQSIIYMNANSGVMVMKAGFRRSPCFVSTISATKPEIESDVSAWNDTTITLTNFLALNATEEPMTISEGTEFLTNNSIPKRFCFPGRIIQTTALTAGDDDADTKTLNFLGFNSQVSLLVPDLPKEERPGRRGPGGRGPGGRGQGGRGQGGRGQGGRGQGGRGQGGRGQGGRGQGGRSQGGRRGGGRG